MKESDRGAQASWIDECELLVWSRTEEEEIGDNGRQVAAQDGATSLVWWRRGKQRGPHIGGGSPRRGARPGAQLGDDVLVNMPKDQTSGEQTNGSARSVGGGFGTGEQINGSARSVGSGRSARKWRAAVPWSTAQHAGTHSGDDSNTQQCHSTHLASCRCVRYSDVVYLRFSLHQLPFIQRFRPMERPGK